MMNPNAGYTPSSPAIRSAVVVALDHSDFIDLYSVLSEAGFSVDSIESFSEAKAVLAEKSPDLLVTCLRLGAYNGLHLVLRGKAVRPDLAAVVVSHAADAALQAEAERLGATFVVEPVSRSELAAVISRTVRGPQDQSVRPPFERRASERRTLLLSTFAGPERRIADRRGAFLAAASSPPTANGI